MMRNVLAHIPSRYKEKFAATIHTLEEGLENTLTIIPRRKISSTNLLERLNKEIRRRTRVVGVFPNQESYIRLVTNYLIEYIKE